jgi:hypothetical protein
MQFYHLSSDCVSDQFLILSFKLFFFKFYLHILCLHTYKYKTQQTPDVVSTLDLSWIYVVTSNPSIQRWNNVVFTMSYQRVGITSIGRRISVKSNIVVLIESLPFVLIYKPDRWLLFQFKNNIRILLFFFFLHIHCIFKIFCCILDNRKEQC